MESSNQQIASVKLTRQEIAKKANQASQAIHQANKQKRRDEYYANPNYCKYCKAVIPFNKRNTSKFCNSSCAAKFNNKDRIERGYAPSIEQRQRVSNTLRNRNKHEAECEICHMKFLSNGISHHICDNCKQKYKLDVNYIHHCKICGAIRGECKRPDICKHHRIFKFLAKYFGFDISAKGTERIYEEYEKARTLIKEEYIDNELSGEAIIKKYNCDIHFANFNKYLKILDIPRRNLQQAGITAVKSQRLSPSTSENHNFITGYHTDWQGNTHFYRSSYELEQMKVYDNQQVNYKVEDLRIMYYDTQQCHDRVAIPDFYLPDSNTIVEIKSTYTLDEQNMKDKFKAYKAHGYNCKLILNHKEVDFS